MVIMIIIFILDIWGTEEEKINESYKVITLMIEAVFVGKTLL